MGRKGGEEGFAVDSAMFVDGDEVVVVVENVGG